MPSFQKSLLLPYFIAFMVSYLITPLVIRFAKKVGIIDDPKKHLHPKVIHTYPVPRGGGVAILVSIIITSIIFLPLDKHLVAILLGAIAITTIGVLDDKYDLNPHIRLVLQLFASGIPIVSGIGIAFIANPITKSVIDLSQPQINFVLFGEARSIWLLSDIFAIFWIVFMMNMLNMGAKGIDGQLPGVASIAALTIALLSLKFSADITQWPVIILALIASASYLGFLPFNKFPQKIMPSYSGSTLAGYMLAILSILSTAKVGTLIVVLGVPLIDTGYVIVRRVLRGRSPVWGDRNHLHHKLLDSGLSKPKIAAFYWLVTLILGAISLFLNTSQKLYTIIGTAVFVGGLILWLTYRPSIQK